LLQCAEGRAGQMVLCSACNTRLQVPGTPPRDPWSDIGGPTTWKSGDFSDQSEPEEVGQGTDPDSDWNNPAVQYAGLVRGLPGEITALGNLRTVYRPNPTLNALGISAGLCLFVVGLVQGINRLRDSTAVQGPMLLTVLLIPLGLGLGLRCLFAVRRVVLVFDHGLAHRTLGKVVVCRWDQVEAVCETKLIVGKWGKMRFSLLDLLTISVHDFFIQLLFGEGLRDFDNAGLAHTPAFARRCRYAIRRRDGLRLVFSSLLLPGVAHLGEQVIEMTRPILLARARDQLHDEGQVAFGPHIQVNRNELRCHDKPLPWTQVDDVLIVRTNMTVTRKDNGPPFCKITVAEVPNVYVLQALARQHLGIPNS
jgi:hypothetical protein